MFNYLLQNWERLRLDRFGAPSRYSWMLHTPPPGNAAPRHLVLLVLDREAAQPVFVAKLPRLAAGNSHVQRQYENLMLAQSARAGGFDSIPRVLATDDVHGSLLLIETALAGRQLTPQSLRREFEAGVAAVVDWLLEFHQGTSEAQPPDFAMLLERPLHELLPVLADRREDVALLDTLFENLEPLRDAPIVSVFEHGDLFYPNILLHDRRVNVLDWETGTPHAFPAGDLFVFLGLAALSRAGSFREETSTKPFGDAFFPLARWAEPFVEQYMRALGIPDRFRVPLFLAAWTRYLISMVWRTDGPTGGAPPLEHCASTGFRETRQYRLWRYTIMNLHKLELSRV